MDSLTQRQSAARIGTTTVANGVKLKNKEMILRGFDYVEQEDFSWDGMDEEFEQFDIYSEKANDILYS